MSRQIQLRRGTATQHTIFTGAEGEVTVDTTNKTLRVHDGATVGGFPINVVCAVKEVGTNYIKYANNVMIQWGVSSNSGNSAIGSVVAMPKAFTNSAYMLTATFNAHGSLDAAYRDVRVHTKTATTFNATGISNFGTAAFASYTFDWIAIGIAT
jgi:hypothetical protein